MSIDCVRFDVHFMAGFVEVQNPVYSMVMAGVRPAVKMGILF